MTFDQRRYEAAIRLIAARMEESLASHRATEFQAGTNFVGCIRRESDGTWTSEIWAWGQRQGLIHAGSSEAVRQIASERYDSAPRN